MALRWCSRNIFLPKEKQKIFKLAIDIAMKELDDAYDEIFYKRLACPKSSLYARNLSKYLKDILFTVSNQSDEIKKN
jgi:hypothetical protein